MKRTLVIALLFLGILVIGPLIMWYQSKHDSKSVFYEETTVTVDSVWFEERSIIEDPYQFIKTSDGNVHVCSRPKYHVGDTIIYKLK